ncbi:MAG: Asp-tRNA(Asn)/Glu-tRNA(Gln) amidotransferase subunit GatB [Chitinophagaceae bacterium]
MGLPYDKYEAVIGLEVHAQLLTESKLFCGDSAAYGGAPNTHISPVTLAHPGTLPKMNRKAVEYAIRLGLACGCGIERYNYFARKNYFYPDLPKGYQVSQHTTPICVGGYVTIRTAEGSRQVQLNRIHMEEDAGKSLHDVDEAYTSIDLNRAGVPLLEIVTEPDLHSGEEAYAYLTELRKLVRYVEVCDGNMEEGSMRCDANISIRLKGETALGTKVEVKNLNSIRNVKKAIEIEIKRLVELVESGGTVIQETRSFDAGNNTTFSLRTKEEANDYRYFPDPDLTPFHLTEDFIEDIRSGMPALPEEKVAQYMNGYRLPEYDARQLADEKETAAYYDAVVAAFPEGVTFYKQAANWLLGPVRSWLNEHGGNMSTFPVTPEKMVALIELVEAGKVNFSIAQQEILPEMMLSAEKMPMDIAVAKNLIQEGDTDTLKIWVEEVIAEMPDKVNEFRKGKKGLIGLFVGEVKKKSKGKADPKRTNDILLEYLNNK